MKYIFNNITRIFKLDIILSMFKFGLDAKKLITLLSIITVSYIAALPLFNLFKRLLFKNNKCENNSTASTLNKNRKYRIIESESCSGCNSNSSKSPKSSKSICIDKKKINKVLRTFNLN
jgi:hypothetical protein